MATAHQDLKVTDLPLEILREIFDYFRDERMDRPGRVDWLYDQSKYSELPENRKTICNSRLVCRRFRDVATPLLLPTVRVKPEQASLDRLDEISRNALVAAGIGGIEVCMACRLQRPATNLADFAFTRQVLFWDTPRRLDISLAWDKLLKSPPADDSQLTMDQAFLIESHREYARLFEDQERLLSSGAFVDAIASAASRMPLFGSLRFEDGDVYPGHQKTEDEDDEPSLRRKMVAAEKWWIIEATAPGFKPSHVLVDLPIAMDKAGVRLRELHVSCFPMAINWPPVRNQDALRSACRHLEEVKYQRDHETDAGYTLNGQRNLQRYLQCVLSGHHMEVLSISSRAFTGNGSILRPVTGPVLGALDGSRLTSVTIGYTALEQVVLDRFCAGLGRQLKRVTFMYIRLVGDGASWGPSLRVLRQKTITRCRESKCKVWLHRLSGGEFTQDIINVTNWLDMRKSRALFEVPGGTGE